MARMTWHEGCEIVLLRGDFKSEIDFAEAIVKEAESAMTLAATKYGHVFDSHVRDWVEELAAEIAADEAALRNAADALLGALSEVNARLGILALVETHLHRLEAQEATEARPDPETLDLARNMYATALASFYNYVVQMVGRKNTLSLMIRNLRASGHTH